jgi:hypothetical protein
MIKQMPAEAAKNLLLLLLDPPRSLISTATPRESAKGEGSITMDYKQYN